MPERIITLCDKCAAEMKNAYKVKPVVGRTTTERKKKCENCGQSYGGTCKQYVVGRR